MLLTSASHLTATLPASVTSYVGDAMSPFRRMLKPWLWSVLGDHLRLHPLTHPLTHPPLQAMRYLSEGLRGASDTRVVVLFNAPDHSRIKLDVSTPSLLELAAHVAVTQMASQTTSGEPASLTASPGMPAGYASWLCICSCRMLTGAIQHLQCLLASGSVWLVIGCCHCLMWVVQVAQPM